MILKGINNRFDSVSILLDAYVIYFESLFFQKDMNPIEEFVKSVFSEKKICFI